MVEGNETSNELAPVEYSDDIAFSEQEQEEIIKYFMDLNLNFIKNFCEFHDISRTGNKPDFQERIIESIDEGIITHMDLIDYVDGIEKYGKQHVFLYNGSDSILDQWNDNEIVDQLIVDNGLLLYRNTRLPIILPQGLALSSIEHVQNRSLEIIAVEAHHHIERFKEYDERKEIEDQDLNLELRAYTRKLKRGFVIFRWDLVLNTASLHIMQLPRGFNYDEMEERFKGLVNPWFDFDQFQKLDLKKVIKKLHELEETDTPETRSHGLGYRSSGGRFVKANSSNPTDSVLGENFIDEAMREIRANSNGFIGNFYWLPSTEGESEDENRVNPLENEIRTEIIGKENRINFSKANKKEDTEYVLSRVRDLC